MKIYIALVTAAAIQSSSATKPQLTVEVHNGNFADIEGLDPKITWEASGESGDFDLEGGVEVAARPTSDLASLPRSIWGKASREWKGWGVSARAELESDKPSQAQIELEAEHEEDDISMKITASAGKELAVAKVEGIKGFDAGDDGNSHITINPRWDVDREDGDVILGWEK
uniref:Uncharacterized protein n=1 Tax=Leptocylindrus danicus TaxID=163516 RepID=A0A7S2KBX2_9STRA|mmetsp:Transcript_20952/g.31261  ORF Transcript_20952/g.31261 Transcript_20952/m.31261 type:complete len:171 (+) Transcript_20952:52-564(+)